MYKMFTAYQLHSNHKAKTYSRYTREKGKKTKHSSTGNHQFTKKDIKRQRKEQEDYKTARKN